MAEVTLKKSNNKEIKGGYTKYGFQIQNPKFDGEWINVVDWDDVHGGKSFSPGDKVDITKPENGEYGWEAKFVQNNSGSESGGGYSNDEVMNENISTIKAQISQLTNYVKQLAAKQDITLTTKTPEGKPDYPEPTKGELNQTFDDDEDDESMEDINW